LLNRIDKTYCYDISIDNGMNPYIGSKINFDKDYSIILRKELIDNLNQEHFRLESLIRSDVELIFIRDINIRKFLKLYNKGVEEFELGNRHNAGMSFRNAVKVMKDDFTSFIISKYNL
jgi:hypothetical protein